jgi:hypothetical protein
MPRARTTPARPTKGDGCADPRLKRRFRHVETPKVKPCPHCDAELRDSVIRCTRCGRSLREPSTSEATASAAGTPSAQPAATSTAVADAPRASGIPSAKAFAATGATWDPLPSGPTSALAEVQAHRALPTSRRSRGPDPWMMLAGIAALVAGVLAFLSVRDLWVHLSISVPESEFEEAIFVELSVKGQTAFAGTAAKALGIALAVFGAVWFLFGFSRGWTIPGIANPALAILVSIAGLGLTVVASMVWFVWEDAAILRAKTTGMSAKAMTELLDRQPAPLVEIERLPGLLTFGGMMVLGLLASSLGWWAYRRRG